MIIDDKKMYTFLNVRTPRIVSNKKIKKTKNIQISQKLYSSTEHFMHFVMR